MNEQAMKEQLAMLKGMTVSTGAIHEAQRLQLECWPRMSKQIERCQPKADFETKTIVLECKTFKSKAFKMGAFEKRLFQEMVGWVRIILWDDTRLVITVNKKRVFDSATH